MSDAPNPFDGPQLQNTEYARADMSGSHFNGVNLDNARFFAVLRGATFNDTNLCGATFDDVNLTEATINNVTLAGSRITNANLSGLSIDGVTMAQTSIQNADLSGMTINGILVTDLLDAYQNAQS